MTTAKQSIAKGPAIQPSCAMLHARESTPDPMTAVIIWATQVHKVPATPKSLRIKTNIENAKKALALSFTGS